MLMRSMSLDGFHLADVSPLSVSRYCPVNYLRSKTVAKYRQDASKEEDGDADDDWRGWKPCDDEVSFVVL
jgi:hypothetical protein